MCLPAVAAIPLAIASAAATAGGQVMQGMQARAQGRYESQIDQQNAGLEVEASHQSVLAGRDERRDFWRHVAQTKGQQIASMAANGIEVDYGSGQRMQDDTSLLAHDDATNLYKNIEERTRGHIINAGNYRSAASADLAKGNAAFTSSLLGAAGSLLGGLSQAGGMKAKLGAG